ncbi:MAG: hypothetical protein JWQ04_752 [Pedosphaera sp.]|nr:hypothetical protein [Pedosphaera sp.]
MKTISKFVFGRLLPVAILITAMSAQALVIVPTFDSSITSDPNAATIESTINTAIQFYETRFSDPITVTILFQEITTSGLYGHSSWWYYNISYSTYRADLQADATTANDTLALAHLPTGSANPVTGSNTVRVKTANLRAIGINGDNSGLAGGHDGIIGLHTSQLNLSRASINPGKGDLLATVEHEIDEVLGLSSWLDGGGGDPLPEDLFRYSSTGARTYTTSGDDAYFSLDGVTLIARFNQTAGSDYGDWWTAGAHTPQVQDANATNGSTPDPKNELIALDAIGYNLLPAPRPGISRITLNGTQLVLKGTNGLAGGTYLVLTSTNAATPLNQWTAVATNFVGTNGNFTITVPNAVNSTEAKRFFALELQ